MTLTDKLTGISLTDYSGKLTREQLQAQLQARVEQLKDHQPWLRREVRPQGPEFEPLYGLVVKAGRGSNELEEGEEPIRRNRREKRKAERRLAQ